jgi:hypothetical protein
MHNRVRMIVGSFLVKDLHLDWTRGAREFMDHLVDGDLASNQHGWQWVAGTGTDAAPFFRVFNPVSQSQRFDPDGPTSDAGSRSSPRYPIGTCTPPGRFPGARRRGTPGRSSTTTCSAARRSPGTPRSRASDERWAVAGLRAAGGGSLDCPTGTVRADARRTQGHHPPGGGGGVHRDGPARGLGPRGQGARRQVSSATVRNDMAALESRGLLRPAPHQRRAHPHREGLPLLRRPPRWPRPLGATETQQVRSFFSTDPRRARADALRHQPAPHRLTDYAAVVVGPPHEVATIKSVQLVSLTPTVLLFVLVLVQRRGREAHHRARRRRR